MKYSPIKRDVSKYRFALPNDIWTQDLKPPAFAALAYLQYRRCRKFSSVITLEELAERTRMSVEMAKACVEALINHKLLTVDLVPLLPNIKGGKFFTVPDEVFYLAAMEFSRKFGKDFAFRITQVIGLANDDAV